MRPSSCFLEALVQVKPKMSSSTLWNAQKWGTKTELAILQKVYVDIYIYLYIYILCPFSAVVTSVHFANLTNQSFGPYKPQKRPVPTGDSQATFAFLWPLVANYPSNYLAQDASVFPEGHTSWDWNQPTPSSWCSKVLVRFRLLQVCQHIFGVS